VATPHGAAITRTTASVMEIAAALLITGGVVIVLLWIDRHG
jgi:hypothetical protein